MIRVNLLKSRVTSTATEGTQTAFGGGSGSGVDAKDALIKLALIFSAIGGLYSYETQNISKLTQNVAAARKKVADKKAENQKRKQQTDSLSHVEKEAKVLEEKLFVLKKISKDRLRVIKMLDSIQGFIPERVWLITLKYDKGALNLSGQAVSDEDLSDFVRNMETAGMFNNVILTQAKEVISAKGSYKTFELKAEVN